MHGHFKVLKQVCVQCVFLHFKCFEMYIYRSFSSNLTYFEILCRDKWAKILIWDYFCNAFCTIETFLNEMSQIITLIIYNYISDSDQNRVLFVYFLDYYIASL